MGTVVNSPEIVVFSLNEENSNDDLPRSSHSSRNFPVPEPPRSGERKHLRAEAAEISCRSMKRMDDIIIVRKNRDSNSRLVWDLMNK